MPRSITIDREAKKLAAMRLNCDNFRRRYSEEGEGVTVKFISPNLYTYEKYRFFLLKNSVKKPLANNYHYRPDYLAYDEYGTTLLWYLLLYINDIPSIEYFDKYEVYVPKYNAVFKLLTQIIPDIPKNVQKIGELEAQLTASGLANNIYYKTPEVPESPEEEVDEVLPIKKRFMRQIFTLTPGQASNGYIDLSYEPTPETIEMKVEHAGNHIYNTDYTLIIASDGKWRRISWKDVDCPDGPGLEGAMRTGTLVEVTYARCRSFYDLYTDLEEAP